jgi:multidrug efflux pump subunit AcrA (membrane-fusion protein)
VEVSWDLGQQRAVWWGRLARIGSSLDPATRTVPLIIEVRNPYKDVRPGVRPPLLPHVFCEITAYGPTVDDVVVIPRDALHQISRESLGDEAVDDAEGRVPVDVVYLLDVTQSQAQEERAKSNNGKAPVLRGRLRMARITVVALEKDSAVISEGIETGDFVIVTDLFPASEGMRLQGERTDSLVGPRGKIDLPDDLFEEVPEAEDPQAGEPPADQSPATAVSEETNP